MKELNTIGNTAATLENAANSENYEWTDMYAGFQRPLKKDSSNLLKISVWLQQSRNSIKSVIVHF